MIFKNAYLKLTLFYVLIVMTISIIFSISLYKISSKEIGRGLGRQTMFLQDRPSDQGFPMPVQELEQMRINQISESNSHLKTNLIYYNLLVLLLSTTVSYFLAKRTLKPIEDAMESQKYFTADASHELRTPLTAMKTEIEVGLRDKKFNLSDAKELLKSNLEEIEKLKSLSGALLKLAKYQEKSEIEFEKLSLSEVITQAYERVEKSANQKNICFKNNFNQVYVKGDRQSLVELFVILLDNAIKYSPKKSKVSIIIKKENKLAVVEIKDQGIGIKSSDLSYIFNRFYRADQSRNKEKIDGYGIGLSIAKRIVELNKGKISVQSKLGESTRIIISLNAILGQN